MKSWANLLKPLLDLFLESGCPLCQRPSAAFCTDCQRQVRRCQLSNSQELWHSSLPLFVWGNYGGALKRSIAALKYENQPHLARPLGHWLAEAWLAAPFARKPLIVVPIPMHPAKQKQRGFNQADLLAQAFCEVTRLPLERRGLERVRSTDAQFSLSVAAREQNLSGAFQPGKAFCQRPPSAPILLLDDIYTTGTTARAAALALKDAGMKVYGLVAIAKPTFEKR